MEAQNSERAALPRDLSEFLVELSVALHRHSMYPSGHPALAPVAEAVVRRADSLLQDRPSIVFGVARRQLVFEGVASDPDHPVLRRLAEGLHRQHIGTWSVMRGVQPWEIGEALHALASDADKQGPFGLTRAGQAGWPHLKLEPHSFGGLALTEETEDGRPGVSGVALWAGLARAALSSDSSGGPSALESEPEFVAGAIDQQPPTAAYDQLIVRHLVQVAREMATDGEGQSEALRGHTSRLVMALKSDTLRRLMDMSGDAARRSQFVLDSAHGMAVDAVLEIVKAAADASGQTISHSLVRMLAKLATHAEMGSEYSRTLANTELREQVASLVEGWHLDDPNPEVHGRMLRHLATSALAGTEFAPTDAAERPDPLRVVQMSLECGTFGPLAEHAIDEAAREGRVHVVLELLAAPPAGTEPVAEHVLARLVRPESISAMLSGDRADLAGLDALFSRLSLDGYEALLDALGSSSNRAVRRRLLELLARTTVDIGPSVIKRLSDERWYVQRNMLMLLARLARFPDGFSVHRWTMHPDSRVRSEAIRVQLMLPDEHAVAVSTSLNDADPRVTCLGLAAIRDGCPPKLVARVIDLALDPESAGDMRLMAVGALGRLREPSALDGLLRLTDGGRSWLGKRRLPRRTPSLIAALRALAETWASDPRAARVLAVAARSSDPELRGAVVPPAP